MMLEDENNAASNFVPENQIEGVVYEVIHNVKQKETDKVFIPKDAEVGCDKGIDMSTHCTNTPTSETEKFETAPLSFKESDASQMNAPHSLVSQSLEEETPHVPSSSSFEPSSRNPSECKDEVIQGQEDNEGKNNVPQPDDTDPTSEQTLAMTKYSLGKEGEYIISLFLPDPYKIDFLSKEMHRLKKQLSLSSINLQFSQTLPLYKLTLYFPKAFLLI